MISPSDIVPYSVKLALIAATALLNACGLRPEPPEGGFPVSDFARMAAYPELLDAATLASILDGKPISEADLAALQARAAALRARGATLSRRRVISEADRAKLAAATSR